MEDGSEAEGGGPGAPASAVEEGTVSLPEVRFSVARKDTLLSVHAWSNRCFFLKQCTSEGSSYVKS